MTVQTRDQAPAASPDHGVACAERSDSHGAGPIGCGGGSGAQLSPPPPIVASVDGYWWYGLVGDSGSGSVRQGWGLSSRT